MTFLARIWSACIATFLAIGVLVVPVKVEGLSKATEPTKGPTINARVERVREKLNAQKNGDQSVGVIIEAQWYNWPNWPNWNNWQNWQNWPNW